MSGDDLHLLGDGSILFSGTATAESHAFVLARLTPGGSLDPTFGDGGVATTFTCPGDPRQPVQRNCFAKPRVNLRVRGLLGPKPSLRLKVKSDVSWASITGVRLVLPRALRMRWGWGEYKFRMRGERVRPRLSRHMVRFTGLATPWLSFSLWRGAFGAAHRLPSHRKLAFRVRVTFHVEGEAPQTVVIRRRP